MALLCPSSHDSVTVSQNAQYQDPETEVTKWNSATKTSGHLSLLISLRGKQRKLDSIHKNKWESDINIETLDEECYKMCITQCT